MNELETKKDLEVYVPIEKSLELVDQDLAKEIRALLPAISNSDLNVREIKPKHNSDFAFNHFVIGEKWTPIAALKQIEAEIRNTKQAIAHNLQKLSELDDKSVPPDVVDYYLGAVQTIKVLDDQKNEIKKNHDLPEVIPAEMWEKDNARAMVIECFKNAYCEAMGSGGGRAGTGYTRFFLKLGISVWEGQSTIGEFIHVWQTKNEVPSAEDEHKWLMGLADKYQDHPFKMQKLLGY